ncbi:hypothetical protein HYX17_00060 [Candidatus Woesearchaeota archaeon]|nr:hypothetical protein [Candidatus Woesearchaeota archaeon]
MDKKSFLVGLLFLAYGLLALIRLDSLQALFTKEIEGVLIILAGFYILITLYGIKKLNVKIATIIVSLVLISIGIFSLLVNFGFLELKFITIVSNQNFIETMIIIFGIYNLIDSLYLN